MSKLSSSPTKKARSQATLRAKRTAPGAERVSDRSAQNTLVSKSPQALWARLFTRGDHKQDSAMGKLGVRSFKNQGPSFKATLHSKKSDGKSGSSKAADSVKSTNKGASAKSFTSSSSKASTSSAAHAAEAYAYEHGSKGSKAQAQPAQHGFMRCLCRLTKATMAFVLVLLMVVAGALYYFLATLSGAQKALEIAQYFIPSSIMVDTSIESGNIIEGLHLGKTLIEVQDVVTVAADNLVLEYDLWQLEHNLFKVTALESKSLHVSLNDKIFEPTDKPPEPSTEPFRLVFPVDIALDRFAVDNFTFSSQIVDVGLGSIELKASAHEDNIIVDALDSSRLTVHLKNEAAQAQETAEIEAADAIDSQLAISVGGQVRQVENLASAVNEVVSAAQQGKSVEFILANAQAESERYAQEQALQHGQGATVAQGGTGVVGTSGTVGTGAVGTGAVGTGVVNTSGGVEPQIAGGQNNGLSPTKVLSGDDDLEPVKVETVNVELSAQDTVPILLPEYSDPEVFAEAIEQALLYEQKVPAFSNGGVVITNPRQIEHKIELTNATLQSSDNVTAASPTKNPLASAQSRAELQKTGALAGDADSVDDLADDESAQEMADRGRQEHGTMPGVADSNSPVVKDFSDGYGAIAPVATVELPFNIEIKHFTVRKLRYVMDGFDTQELDLDLAGNWFGTKIQLDKLDVYHGLGEVSLLGSLNLDRYFDFDVKLSGEGYQNDETKQLFEGVLYGLGGDIDVQGDLTNLQVDAKLNLGGYSHLKVQLNALSAALPMEVSLTTEHFAYPIFAEPIVDLKSIDFHSMGNLVDGVDVTLQSEVSGFDFKDVKADFKGQLSFEKSHIDNLQVNGTYLGEPLEARASGDLFYGSVLGADMKVFAKVKDAGFVHEMLSGPLFVDADLIAIMNNKLMGKSAVGVASQPAYLENRIPVIQVSSEDFDPEAMEKSLLAAVSPDKLQQVARVRPITRPKNSPQMLAGGVADTAAEMEQIQRGQLAAVHDAARSNQTGDRSQIEVITVDEVAQAEAQAGNQSVTMPDTVLGMASNQVALPKNTSNMGQEQIITQDQYISALEQNNAQLVKNDEVMSTLFNKDLPEIKTDIRHVRAELFVNKQKTTVDIENVVGDLQKGFRIQLLKLVQGTNVIQAQGQLMERKADLVAVLNLNDFSAFVPDLKGEFKGQLAATGSMRDLNFTLSGHVPKLDFNEIRVRKLVFDTAFNLQTQAFNVTALADRLRLTKSMKASRQFFLDFSGTPLRHNVTMTCDGSTSLYLSVDGSLDSFANSYNANLLELYLSTEEAGTLSLINPVFVNVDLNTTSGSAAPVELKGEIGSIKLERTKFAPGYVATKLAVREFNLKSLKDFYPKGIFMHAPMDLDVDILVKNSQPDIKAHISSNKGVFASSEVSAGLAYDNFDLTATFTPQLMHSELTMNLRHSAGMITSVVNVKDPMGKGSLSGNFVIDDFDLKTIANIGQSFAELNGMAQMHMEFGGTVYNPLIFGDFTVEGDAVPRYDVGQINKFNVKLTAQGQKGVLDGVITLNETDLNLAGNLDWSNGANGNLTAKAQNMAVFLVGYGIARANIDAAVKLGEILDIKADVLVPSARISVNDVASSGVVVSGDEIIVPDQGSRILLQKMNATPPMKTKMDVSVKFGDDVQVSALGMVKGHLEGGLKITQNLEDQIIKGNGEIQMVDATAEVFSRKFNVDEARINFKNNLTNPSLYVSVLADKDYVEDDVEVGIRVTGQATSPDIKLFSKPSMSENEILSYILYGHGLEKSSIAQDSNNSNMLLGLGISSMSGLVNSLAGAFGVQGLQVGSQGSGDETQVQVQGYISRNLRLSYGYGVFTAVGEFKLRYELMHQLYVEYVSSIEQAVDLVYSFSFD